MTAARTPAVRFQTVDGIRIRYVDSGDSHGSTVLLTSPWPERMYALGTERIVASDAELPL